MVADEVRKLSGSSEQAAHEIATMAAGISTDGDAVRAQMEDGMAAVASAQARVDGLTEVFDTVVKAARSASTEADGVAAASSEQSSAARGVAQDVERISVDAESNVALAREAQAAASALSGEANALNETIERYRV